MRTLSVLPSLLLLGLIASSDMALAQAPVKIVDLTTPDAVSSDRFGNIFSVRPLADNKVLIDDGIRRQLVVLDASLRERTVLLDSVSLSGNGYGRRASPLIPYLGDSSLFVDLQSSAILVISPQGRVARVMSVPRSGDLLYMANAASGTDREGRVLYRGRIPTTRDTLPDGQFTPFRSADFAPLLRANFETRSVDTIGQLKVVRTRIDNFSVDASGRPRRTTVINPLTSIDEWAVLADGSLAIVRGGDYHVDWVASNGHMFSSAKLPFDWKRVTDSAKVALLDSARAQVQKEFDDEGKAATAGGGGGGAGMSVPVARTGSIAGIVLSAPMSAPAAPARTPLVMENAPLSEIADFYPSIRNGAAKADLDGNLWILPTTSAQSKNGELVYDVVNNRGDLLQRVRVPAGRSIAGFGHGGVVFLMSRDGENGWVLERSRVPGSTP